MISRLLARLISGNLRVNAKPENTSKGQSKLLNLLHRLWVKLLFKDAQAPEFHFHRASLVLSLVLVISLISLSSFSYWYHTDALPSVLLEKAESAALAGNFRSEVEWRRRYLLVSADDIETQGRLALAIDSLLRNENLDDGNLGTFEAIRQLEIAENLSDELNDKLNRELRRRLAKRYLEASDILANAARRQDDEPMEDSLLGESIGYLTKAMRKLDTGVPQEEESEVDLAIQKLAVRRAILEQSIHSLATFKMRSDTQDIVSTFRDAKGRSESYSKKQSLWFDDALRNAITSKHHDGSFLNFLLSHRDNDEYPWNKAYQDEWRSQIWQELPQLISDRVRGLNSNQGKLISLQLESLSGDKSTEQVASLWADTADQLCAKPEIQAAETNSEEDVQVDQKSTMEELSSRDELLMLEAQAEFAIIYNAWQRHPVDRLDEKSTWWLKMFQIAKEDQTESLASLLVSRAERHITNGEIKKASGYLQQAINLDGVTPLQAYEMLATIDLDKAIDGPETAGIDSAIEKCESSLDRYLNAIVKQTRELEQLGLPETDRFKRSRRRFLLAHRVNQEVMNLEYRWGRDRTIPPLDRFNELLTEADRLELSAAFELAQVDRVAKILNQASDTYSAAKLFENALSRHPKDPSLRNRCFDIWFKLGNLDRADMHLSTATSLTDVHGETRILFMRLLKMLREPEQAEAVQTLREQAEVLQLRILEDEENQSITKQQMGEVTRRVLRYIQIMLPDADVPLREHIGSPLMRQRLFEFAKTESSYSWITGLAYALLQFELPENRKRWIETLANIAQHDSFSSLLSRCRADDAMGHHWPAIRRLLDADGLTKSQLGLARLYAANLAEIAAGHAAKREVLLSIAQEDRTPQQWFQLCFSELNMITSARDLAMTTFANGLRKQFDQHRASLASVEGDTGKFTFLINAWFDFELEAKEYRSNTKKTEVMKRLASVIDRLLETEPWWTPLLTLRGLIAAESNDARTAVKHLSLALKGGDQSIETKRQLIKQLDQIGVKNEADQIRRQLERSLRRHVSIWNNYRTENPQLRNPAARLTHHQNLAMTHDVANVWLMWARSLADACRQSVTPDRHQEFLRLADYCLTRVEQLGESDSLPTLMLRHRIAIVRSNLSEARKIEEAISALSTRDTNASDALITCVLSRGETKKAIELLQALNETEPTEDRLIKQAQCQNGIGLTDEAESALKKAIELFPESDLARENLARWISVKKNPQEAKDQLRDLLLADSSDPSRERNQLTYVQLINNLGNTAQTDRESIDLLLRIAATDGVYAEAASHAALRLTSRSINRDRFNEVDTESWLAERLDDCFNTLDTREWITPSDLSSYGTAVTNLHPRVAQSKMDKVLERVANLGDSRLHLSLELEWWKNERPTQELAKIIERWRKSVIQDKSVQEPIANCLACTDHVSIGNIETAVSIFSEAFFKTPQIIETYFRLLTEANHTDQLVTFANHAIQLSTKDEQYALIAQTGIRYLTKLPDETAIEVAERLIELCPNSLPVLDFASQMHFNRGQNAKASVLIARINEIQPNQALVLNNLAMCLIEIPGEVGHAIEIAEKANRLAPHDASIMDTLAVALLRDGQSDRAVKQLEAAIAIRKEPRFLFHLLIAYEQLGKQDEYEEARSLLGQIQLDVSGLTASEKAIYEKKFL